VSKLPTMCSPPLRVNPMAAPLTTPAKSLSKARCSSAGVAGDEGLRGLTAWLALPADSCLPADGLIAVLALSDDWLARMDPEGCEISIPPQSGTQAPRLQLLAVMHASAVAETGSQPATTLT
jgi:hypothetical protein